MASEQLLERLLTGTEDCLVLCQYDAAALRPRALETLRSVHDLELAPVGPRPLGRTVAGLSVVPGGCGMAVSGEVDMRTWAALGNACAGSPTWPPTASRSSSNLSGLSFIDGHGVGLIGQAARALGPSGRLVLRGPPPTLLRIAGIPGLDREPGLTIGGKDGDGRR